MPEKFEALTPSDFFYRNRSIAGFTDDRAIYQTVREAVENALDGCEAAKVLPFIRVKLSEVSKQKNLYKLTVTDNGCGIHRSAIANAFGTFLFGSKFHLRQERGTFGLGIKMAILYSQITTNEPVRILTSTGTNVAYDFLVKIHTQENRPVILKGNTIPNLKNIKGTLISLYLKGKINPSDLKKIEMYLKLTAVANPSATIELHKPDNTIVRFERSSIKIPKQTKIGKPHPHGVDIEMLKRLSSTNKNKTLLEFLSTCFDHVGENTAKKFLKFAGLNEKIIVGRLREEDYVKLYDKLKSYNNFIAPSSSVLSPIGEEDFENAVKKAFNPQFVKAKTRPPCSYSGFPFIVEACIAYGDVFSSYGKGLQVFRFANKIPLLYDLQGDAMWKVAKSINWTNYKINPKEDPVAIFYHICSLKISYKNPGKEMLAQVEEVMREARRATFKVANQLSSFLTKRERETYRKKRLGIYERYLPEIARSVSNITKDDEKELLNLMLKVVRGE